MNEEEKLLIKKEEEREIKRQQEVKGLLPKRAKEAIEQLPNMTDAQKNQLFNEYMEAFNKYEVNFEEYYYQYDFPHLSERKRKKYIACAEMWKYYRVNCTEKNKWIFRNKARFLYTFPAFIHREWMLVDANTDREKLQKLLDTHDVIVKPLWGTQGKGIYKLNKGEGKAEEFDVDDKNKKYIVEEYLKSDKELAQFHPQSLNTIRVVTFSNKEDVEVFAAVLRTGNGGSCVDNAHNGGLFAKINVKSGKVITHGVDTENRRYKVHPASGKKFKGFVIPKWNEITALCKKACRVVPEMKIVGWDIAICEDGTIEIIEGNDAPDIDMLQFADGKGLREEIEENIRRFELKAYKNYV